MNPDIFGMCAVDDYSNNCVNVRCSHEDMASFQLSVITILPCSFPPAVKVFLADSELQAQINVTVSKTTNGIPFLNTSLGSLNIRIEVNSAKTSIGLGVRHYRNCSNVGSHKSKYIPSDSC